MAVPPSGVGQRAAGGGEQQRAERDGQPRQDGLGLGIPEPRVALEQDRAVRREHQAGVQRATERRPAPGQLGEDRFVDRREQGGGLGVRQVLDRAEGAHAARVRALVAVAEPLVVARDGQADRATGHRTGR